MMGIFQEISWKCHRQTQEDREKSTEADPADYEETTGVSSGLQVTSKIHPCTQ